VELYLHSPNTPSWRGAHLKHRDNFTFYIDSASYNAIARKPALNGSLITMAWSVLRRWSSDMEGKFGKVVPVLD
jgi:hypothetical protein